MCMHKVALEDARDQAQAEYDSGKASAVDGAATQLRAMQRQGALPRMLYGRIADLGQVNDARAAAAVNAVLTEACDLVGSCRAACESHCPVCSQLQLCPAS